MLHTDNPFAPLAGEEEDVFSGLGTLEDLDMEGHVAAVPGVVDLTCSQPGKPQEISGL